MILIRIDSAFDYIGRAVEYTTTSEEYGRKGCSI
jgi:hypothetical protein